MSEDTSGIELSRRRLLGGLVVTGTAATGAGAGTWALFQDTETSSGNTIRVGTLDLVVSDSDEQYSDGVSGTWTIEDAKPGDSILADVSLQNEGSLVADHVEFDISVDETEADGPTGSNEGDTAPSTAEGMAEQFEVKMMTYDGTDILSHLSDSNGNGITDIGDLVDGNDGALDDLTPPPSANGGTESLSLAFRWANDSEFDTSVSGVNNDYQGDTLDITVTMALHQESSQDIS